MADELKRIWSGSGLTKALFLNLPGQKKIIKILSYSSWCPNPYQSWAAPKGKSRVYGNPHGLHIKESTWPNWQYSPTQKTMPLCHIRWSLWITGAIIGKITFGLMPFYISKTWIHEQNHFQMLFLKAIHSFKTVGIINPIAFFLTCYVSETHSHLHIYEKL